VVAPGRGPQGRLVPPSLILPGLPSLAQPNPAWPAQQPTLPQVHGCEGYNTRHRGPLVLPAEGTSGPFPYA
jgi:hypothetical protein